MITALFCVIFIALLCVLGTRRIGFSQWQFYAVSGLIALAAIIGRCA